MIGRRWPLEAAVVVGRLLLAAVLLLAAWPKVLEPDDFARDVANYRLLPEGLAVNLTAAVLPFIELFAGAMLLAGYRLRAAAGLALLLALAFLAGTTSALVRDLNIRCGCFGSADSGPLTWWHAAGNALMAGLALLLIYRGPDRLCVDHRRRPLPAPWESSPANPTG